MKNFTQTPNGDTRATLQLQGLKIRDTAEELIKALRLAMPHGRNYRNSDELAEARTQSLAIQAQVTAIAALGNEIAEKAS